MNITQIQNEGMIANMGFTHTMPLGILSLYKTVMRKLANRSMQIAVAIVKDRGVYNFSFVDKKGKELYRMIFLRGIYTPEQIMKYRNMALLPYSVKSKEDLIGLENEIEDCLTQIDIPKSIYERIERFLQLRI